MKDLKLLRCQISSKLLYRFSAISVQIPAGFFFFCRNSQADFKLGKYKRSRITKNNLEKLTFGRLTLSDLEPCYKTTIIKTIWH